MAKRGKTLELEDKACRLGKISNNLEKHGGEWVTGFTIPFTGLMLTKPELNAFMRDKYCHQSWFDTTKPGAAQPMAWWSGESFYVSDTFEADTASIQTSAEKPLEFESEGDPKDDPDKYRPAMTFEKLVLTPKEGGFVEVSGSLYCRPGIGRVNLALQDHQHREVKLTVTARATEKAKRQPQLPLGDAAAPIPEGGQGGPENGEAAATH